MSPKTVSSTRTQLAQIMTPIDANVLGKVFGGSLLAMIDLTASATAQKFSGHICVTAAFDRVDFHEPVEVGNLVSTEGFVSYAGRTSMEITIDVTATDLKSGQNRHTNTARVTMVAIEDGKPTPVPDLIVENREEKIRFLEGKVRRELRTRQIAERDRLFAQFQELDESELDRFLKHQDAFLTLFLPETT
jgi:acyl-CoA hydrolase